MFIYSYCGQNHKGDPGGRREIIKGDGTPIITRVPGPHNSVRPCPFLGATAVAREGAGGGRAARGGRQWARVGRGEGDVVAWRVGMAIRVASGTVAVTGPSRGVRAGAGGDAGEGRRHSDECACASQACSEKGLDLLGCFRPARLESRKYAVRVVTDTA